MLTKQQWDRQQIYQIKKLMYHVNIAKCNDITRKSKGKGLNTATHTFKSTLNCLAFSDATFFK